MSVTHVSEKKYRMETIVLAFEYFASSRTVQNRLTEDLQLPSLRTLKWLTSKVRALVDDVYVRNIFLNYLIFFLLASCCYMKWNEMYVTATLQYHGGVAFGKEVGKTSSCKHTVQFYVSGILCRIYFPLQNAACEKPSCKIYSIIIDASKCAEGNLVAVISDRDRFNQSFWK